MYAKIYGFSGSSTPKVPEKANEQHRMREDSAIAVTGIGALDARLNSVVQLIKTLMPKS